MRTNTDFAKYISRFLSEYLPHERNMSFNTILAYRDAFLLFIDYMNENEKVSVDKLSLRNFTMQNVSNFLIWLQNVRNCSIATRNHRLAAIHSFILFLQYEDIQHLDEWQRILAIKSLKAEKKIINYLSIDAIKLLLEQPDTTLNKGRRDLALLALMYDTGGRVQEIADLTPESVRILHEPFSVCIRGKGRKTRIIPLMKEQTNILRKYMEENDLFSFSKIKTPLFFNSRKEKLTRSGITYILKTYINMARHVKPDLIPPNVCCHSIRHSKAMHLLQAGVNLVYIRDILGHISIQTTEIYARVDSKQKRKALEECYIDLNPDSINDREWEKNRTLIEWLKGF